MLKIEFQGMSMENFSVKKIAASVLSVVVLLQPTFADQLLGAELFNVTGNLKAGYDGNGNAQQSTYNSDGSVADASDRMEQHQVFNYDTLGRVSTVSSSNTVSDIYHKSATDEPISYSYEGNTDRISMIEQGDNSISYAYDVGGHVISTVFHEADGTVYTLTYGYDAYTGNLIEKSDSNGVIEKYYYSINGLASVVVNDGKGNTLTFSYQYDNAGHLVALLRSNGLNSYFSYDDEGRVDKLIIGSSQTDVLLSYDYSYTLVGNISSIIAASNITGYSGSVTMQYGYNSINQLEQVKISGDESLFPKDSFGMEISQQDYSYTLNSGLAKVKTYYSNGQYDLATFNYYDDYPDRLESVSHSGDYDYETMLNNHYNSGSYRYDDDGNMTQDAYGNQYVYNSLGQQTTVNSSSNSGNSVNAAYEYYPDGSRASETSTIANSKDTQNGKTVDFFYDGGKLSEMVQGDSNKYVIPGLAEIIDSGDENSVIHYLYRDIQDNVITATDSQKTVQHFYAYTPYGIQSDLLNPINTAADSDYDPDDNRTVFDINNLLFGYAGALFDSSTQRITLGNGYRDYDPVIGRFGKKDSYDAFSGQGTYNGYNYASANPMSYDDPTGHMSFFKQFNSSKFDAIFFGSMAVGLVTGAAFGIGAAAMASSMGADAGIAGGIGGVVGGAMGGAAQSISAQLIGNSEYGFKPGVSDWNAVGISAGFGAAMGLGGDLVNSLSSSITSRVLTMSAAMSGIDMAQQAAMAYGSGDRLKIQGEEILTAGIFGALAGTMGSSMDEYIAAGGSSEEMDLNDFNVTYGGEGEGYDEADILKQAGSNVGKSSISKAIARNEANIFELNGQKVAVINYRESGAWNNFWGRIAQKFGLADESQMVTRIIVYGPKSEVEDAAGINPPELQTENDDQSSVESASNNSDDDVE
ncbi:MAG: RHS repeat domain-containing protein [Francisellaceae bacterium]